MEDLKKRLSNLLAVKSIVTVILTAVFADLSMAGRVTTDQFLTVFTVRAPARTKQAVRQLERCLEGAAGQSRELWRFPGCQSDQIPGVP